MKMRNGLACLMAAVAMVSVSRAADLTWDASGAADPAVTDGSGSWDFLNDAWFNGTTNVSWSNGNSAIFGSTANTAAAVTPHSIDIAGAIEVQDITLAVGASGAAYDFSDFGGGSLTLLGNITKVTQGLTNTPAGVFNFFMTNGITLSAGDHVIRMIDSPNDAPSEMTFNAEMKGAGGLTIDNGPYEAWGTAVFNFANTYTGLTQVKFGRMVINDSAGLGSTSSGTVISGAGTLGLGGAGTLPPSGLNIAEPIRITRDTYDGGEFGRYRGAIYSVNGSGTHTLSGPFVVDSTEARIRVETSTIDITSDITYGTNVTGGTVAVDGDVFGYLKLSGNNTALTGGVTIYNGTLIAENHNNIGGPTAPINFRGGGYFHPVGGFMTSFGDHVINTTSFSGGLEIDAGQSFTINEDLSGGNSLSMRGSGTLNLNGNIALNGASFYDDGVLNINGTVAYGGLRVRRTTVNINDGASFTTTNAYTSISMDSGEASVVNISGQFIAANQDFNISDNANTQGTVNISGNGLLQTNGITFVGKSNGSVGTINQTGGRLEVKRTGNFALVLGSRRGIGNYNMSGGTLAVDGEFYVGQGNGGSVDRQGEGFFNMSGGTATVNNWFVIGREGAWGHVVLSNGAVFTKQGGGNVEIDAFSIANVGETPSDMTVDNATFNVATGELRIGTYGGANGTLTLKNNAIVNTNSWVGIGRDNGKGALNIEGGTFTKAGPNNISIAWQPNSDGRIVQSGGVLNVTSGETWISEGGVGLIDVSGGAMNLLRLDVGRAGGKSGTLEVRGTGSVTADNIVVGHADAVAGIINLSGGSLKANSIAPGGSSGAKTFNFTGGTLSVGSFTLAGTLANSGTGTLAPGGVGTAAATTVGNGGYTQAESASLAIDLGGSTAGAFDSVASTGAVTIAGTLNLTRLGGYDPALLTAHTILSGTSLGGTFTTVGGVVITPTKRLAVTYTPTSVLVTSARAGDTNLDGAVNFDDLLTLAQNYGSTTSRWSIGDFDGDGKTIFDDLLALAQNYGLSGVALPTDLGAGFSSTFSADWARALQMVPEPTALAVVGVAGIGFTRRRR